MTASSNKRVVVGVVDAEMDSDLERIEANEDTSGGSMSERVKFFQQDLLQTDHQLRQVITLYVLLDLIHQ